MSQERIFPFRRVSVDHMVRGVSRVWWQLEKLFKEPGPYVFQLQFGRTGLRNASDWVDVGTPVTNGYFAFDPAWREAGYTLTTHYRVKLTTPQNVYVSQATSAFGELTERDWLLAREIVRKEQLRHRLVSIPGFLIKPMRYGVACPAVATSYPAKLLTQIARSVTAPGTKSVITRRSQCSAGTYLRRTNKATSASQKVRREKTPMSMRA